MTDTTVEQTAGQPEPKVRLGPQYVKLWTASVISNLGDGIALRRLSVAGQSAITRNPLLIALIAVAQRLPWLVFTLPAGVITDRVDRRRLIVLMDVVRAGLTLVVGFFVLAADDLPYPGRGGRRGRVLRRRACTWCCWSPRSCSASPRCCATTRRRPSSPPSSAPRGWRPPTAGCGRPRWWPTRFVGPPLGSLLIAVAFALPFFVDAGSFAVAAGLVFMLTGNFRRPPAATPERRSAGRPRSPRVPLAVAAPAAAPDGDHPRRTQRAGHASPSPPSCSSPRRCSRSMPSSSPCSPPAARSAGWSAAGRAPRQPAAGERARRCTSRWSPAW